MNRPKRVDMNALNSCEVDTDLLIFSPERKAVFSLNASARAVLDLCDGQRTADDICAVLAQDLGLPEAALIQDVRQALQLLTEAQLIHDAAG